MAEYNDYDNQDAALCDSFNIDGRVDRSDPEGCDDWDDVLEADDNKEV